MIDDQILNGAITGSAKALWKQDYPNGGSVYSDFEMLPYHDIEFYRKQAIEHIVQSVWLGKLKQ